MVHRYQGLAFCLAAVCLAVVVVSVPASLPAQTCTSSAWDEKKQKIAEAWVELLRKSIFGEEKRLTLKQKQVLEGVKWMFLWHRTIQFEAPDAYKEMLVAAIARSQKSKGDNLNHIFYWRMLAEGAPPHVWIRIVAEEMNPGGRLEHVLDEDPSVRMSVEWTLRSPFIRGLVAYWYGGLSGVLPEKRTGLLSYMFRSNPVMTAEIIMEELPGWFDPWYLGGKEQQLRDELLQLKKAMRLVQFITWGKYHRLPRDPEIEARARAPLARALESPLWLSRAVAVVVLERNPELRTPESEKKLQRIVSKDPQDEHPVVRVLGRDLYRERLQNLKRQR